MRTEEPEDDEDNEGGRPRWSRRLKKATVAWRLKKETVAHSA
jgi:hypothetical protein